MFLKFLVACLVLAGLLIFGGAMVVQNETRFRNRGNWLAKHLRRYVGYQDRIGKGMTGTLEILAADPQLVAALAPPKPPVPPEAPPATPPRSAKDIVAAMHDKLKAPNGLKPDLFAGFTAGGQLVWSTGPPIDQASLSNIAAVEKARVGAQFAHRVQVIENVPYQVSAIPVVDGETVVGGLLLGVKLQRYFEEYAEQSDDVVELRMRPTLIDGVSILASAFPPDKKSELAKSMQPDKFVRVTVGEDTRDVIRLKDGDHDFYFEELDGYKNGDAVTVGKLFITRSRSSIVDPASELPWRAIAVAVGLSVLIATLLGFWITRPIKQFVRQSRDLLQGDTDLTQRIVVKSSDETAALAENINQVFTRLHGLATEVQSAAFHVGASSAEISAASKQMLGGLKDQTLKIESSTTAVTELSASIQTVAGNAAQATEVAEQSNVAVGSAVQRMEQIRTSVEEAAGKMRELGESSKRIGNIVEVIRQISEQTSMLALNASIEAAHAGEQGRGFAVVADEVSSLARRVGQSAKDIEALIQTVKEQTQAAIASMENGRRDVENGSALVTTTLNGLGHLIHVVKDTATAVQEQAVVSDEIARNMDAVRTIAGEVLSGSEESVVQAERLHELAFQLEESIGGFNLDGSGKPQPARRGNGAPDGKRRIGSPNRSLPTTRASDED
jgi:methyl-accepting chemotaxis protein